MTSSVAAALLLTRRTSSAPVSEQTNSRMACSRWMREPSPMSICRLQQPMTDLTASRAASGITARPSPVWSRMPVAFTAGLRLGMAVCSSRSPTSCRSASMEGGSVSTVAESKRPRASSTALRIASATSSWPYRSIIPFESASSSTLLTEGSPLAEFIFMSGRIPKQIVQRQECFWGARVLGSCSDIAAWGCLPDARDDSATFDLFIAGDDGGPRKSCVGLPFDVYGIHGAVILLNQAAQFSQSLVVIGTMGQHVDNRSSMIGDAHTITLLDPAQIGKGLGFEFLLWHDQHAHTGSFPKWTAIMDYRRGFCKQKSIFKVQKAVLSTSY